MTKQDYDKRVAELNWLDFCAEMSDDYRNWESEKRYVKEQREKLEQEAREAGII